MVKINEGKILVALSDGMGSGISAENTSSAAISLIESFYKAGLKSELILSANSSFEMLFFESSVIPSSS